MGPNGTKQDKPLIALAMAAHPDDIEFMMSGTLLLLKQADAEIHVCNLANGCYGSQVYGKEEAARVRALEAQEAARVAGAIWHPPFFDDTGIFYDAASLAKVSAVIREIQPDILLTLSRYDYMEDHEYASRLASSAAFNRCLPSYITDPPQPATNKPVAVYHSLPHALMDMQRVPIVPEFCIDVSSVMAQRRAMLACHTSQREWLDATQGMGSYVESMVDAAREVGRRYGGCEFAEGWRRHNHMGYCAPDYAPLETALAPFLKQVK
ncbi:MAG TPA: PIG-L family deacetylase [Kiritimatiellia bacterium]|nr:PIG-L family deacetylase [Kiritimatiellia bacterium]HRU71524.1 PIG-L family deacetylase [Kiritimatiellia bacterium]